jgi:hypothetical protein
MTELYGLPDWLPDWRGRPQLRGDRLARKGKQNELSETDYAQYVLDDWCRAALNNENCISCVFIVYRVGRRSPVTPNSAERPQGFAEDTLHCCG